MTDGPIGIIAALVSEAETGAQAQYIRDLEAKAQFAGNLGGWYFLTAGKERDASGVALHELIERGLSLLRSDRWVAEGFLPHASDSETIPRQWWLRCEVLNPVRNSAEWNGKQYSGLMVRSADVAEGGRKPKAPPAYAPERDKSRGVAPSTLNAVRALAALLHLEGKREPGSWNQTAVARRAAEIAQELDLPGADLMKPENGTFRQLAQAVMEGVARADAGLAG